MFFRDGMEMQMAEYALFVKCSNKNGSRGTGRPAKGEYADDETAISALKKIAEEKIIPFYDFVKCEIKEGDRIVASW